MLDKHFIFAVCYVVFVILCAIVNISECNVGKNKKKSKEKQEEKPEEIKSFYILPPPVNATNATFFDFDEFKKLPPMPLITYGPYTFEGVDYDTIPEGLLTTYNDCHGQYTRCVRNRVYFQQVCAYNIFTGWVTFRTQCQLDYQNCLYRVDELNISLYGTGVKDDREFYNGDGWYCKHALANKRRADGPDGTVLLYFEDQKSEDDYVDN